MRFIVMHKVDAIMENGGPPSQEIIQEMGALVQGSLKSGVFLNGAGLHRSASRARVTTKSGRCEVEKGPYAGKNELISSLVMISARSMDDAVAHASRLALELGDSEIEVGPVVEPWDLGLMPKPEGQIPEKFLFLFKSTADDEQGVRVVERHREAVEKLSRSFDNDGVVLAAECLAPSAQGARSSGSGKRTWVDGPFTETKELIAGFSLLRLPTLEEALAWADRYAAILGDTEVEVRLVYER